jgi:fatty acid synthase subunit beta
MNKGASLLHVGDVYKAEVRIVSVINSDRSKDVKVSGFVFRGGNPVIEVSLPRRVHQLLEHLQGRLDCR